MKLAARSDSRWIRPAQAYAGWGWVLALAGLWMLFALMLGAIAELQRGYDGGAVTRAVTGYYLTAAAALFVAICAFLRRQWARQLLLISTAPMLLLFPIGTVVAAFALRALLKQHGFFASSPS